MEVKIVLKKLHEYGCDQCSEKFYRLKDIHAHAQIHSNYSMSNAPKKVNVIKRIKCEFCKTELKRGRDHVDNVCQCKQYEYGNTNKRKPKKSEDRNRNNQQTEMNERKTRIKLECKETNESNSKFIVIDMNNKKSSINNVSKTPSMKDKKEDLACLTQNAKSPESPENHVVDNDTNSYFTCGKCPKSFKTFSAMSTHLLDHSGPPYRCLKCPKTFGNSAARNKHVKLMHLAKYDIECPTCQKKFKSHTNLKIHLRVHTGERPFSCKECGKRFTQGAALYTHTKIHLGLKEHVCSYCKRAFTEYHNMRNHERTHTNERPFVCKYCKRAFSDPSALKRHVRTHTGDKIYPCEQCHMKFSDASGLIAHRRRHAGIKTFSCQFCSKLFYTHSELVKHEASVHMDLKRFECDLCSKKFTLKQYLKWHMERNHMSSIRCSICTMKFYSNIDFGKHILSGCTKDKFECDICGIKVPLKIHLKNHMENKHFQALYCHICLAKFYTAYHLQKHKAKGSCLKKLYVEDRVRGKENKEGNRS